MKFLNPSLFLAALATPSFFFFLTLAAPTTPESATISSTTTGLSVVLPHGPDSNSYIAVPDAHNYYSCTLTLCRNANCKGYWKLMDIVTRVKEWPLCYSIPSVLKDQVSAITVREKNCKCTLHECVAPPSSLNLSTLCTQLLPFPKETC
ncbi:hypothetical protein VTO42DRAFT_7330 [Malbranchea cinnamomea]